MTLPVTQIASFSRASPARLCFLTMAMGAPFFLYYLHIFSAVLSQPDAAHVARPMALDIINAMLIGVLLLDVLLALWLWPRRDSTDPQFFSHLTLALAHSSVLVVVNISVGTYTSAANLSAVITLVIGLALQPRKAVVIAFIWSTLLIIIYQGLVNAGMASYAPALVAGSFENQVPVPWWQYLRAFFCFGGLLAGLGLMFWMFDLLDRQREELVQLSHTDSLTRLANRRYFMERMEHELRRRDRYHYSPCLVVCDLDHFKKINDTYGHLTGDEVLRQLGRIFREALRTPDIAARMGGEEFALLLPDTSVEQARALCERISTRMRHLEFHAHGNRFHVTISMGVVGCSQGMADALLKAADRNLYRAKNEGRDRVICSVTLDDTP